MCLVDSVVVVVAFASCNVGNVELTMALPFVQHAAPQVEYITKKYHVYMLKNGRANMCGLTEPTVPYFATAIDDAVRNVQGKL